MLMELPLPQVLQDGRFKSRDELAKLFAASGLDISRPVVTSCGTGVTASILALALHHISPERQVLTLS